MIFVNWNADRIAFYKSVDYQDFYIMLNCAERDIDTYYQKLNRIGFYDDSKFEDGKQFGYIIGKSNFVSSIILSHLLLENLFNFIKEKYVIEHKSLPNPDYDNFGWFKFHSFEPEKWLNDFYDFQKQKESPKTNGIGIQTSLF